MIKISLVSLGVLAMISLSPAQAWAVTCPSLVAHDGYTGAPVANGPVPPNSVGALRLAARIGARAVKFDLRWSSDNVPVTIHNPTVYASTGYRSGGTVLHHHGLVADKTAATLTGYHLLTRLGAWTTELLPSTRTMLAAALAAGLSSAIIEIKVDGITQGQVASLRAAVTASGAAGITSIQTFFPQNVTALQAGWPGVYIALLEHSAVTPPAGVSSVVLTGDAVTAAAVSALAGQGYKVGAYTSTGSGVPDTAATWASLRDMGIRQIFTDDAQGYLDWRAAGCPS